MIVDCFNRLPGLEFQMILRNYKISARTCLATIARQKNWDRRFITKGERRPGDYPEGTDSGR